MFGKIHDQQISDESLETNYKLVYNATMARDQDKLLDDAVKWHRDRLSHTWTLRIGGTPPATELSASEAVVALQNFMETWQQYWEAIELVEGVLMYTERATDKNLRNIFMEVFLDSVQQDRHASPIPNRHQTVLELLTSIAFSHIYGPQLDADSYLAIQDLVGSCFRVLDELCATSQNADAKHAWFKQLIDGVYLEPVRKHYAREAAALASTSSVLTYCETARRWLMEEECRCHTILPRHMREDMRSLIVETALQPHLKDVAARNRDELMSLNTTASSLEVSVVYEILSMVWGKEFSGEATENHPPSTEKMVEAMQDLVLQGDWVLIMP
ncbi:cullin-3 [Colletotrichum musicola]|uniref:Cullin-3 n=1 Tax=Colletotrichum musicola TaxID=2175873 RepID=A0A8H6K9M5_9PEZI|nr:cullin-3 [Colletotrichum musicola]